jgi:hypothetical protein
VGTEFEAPLCKVFWVDIFEQCSNDLWAHQEHPPPPSVWDKIA